MLRGPRRAAPRAGNPSVVPRTAARLAIVWQVIKARIQFPHVPHLAAIDTSRPRHPAVAHHLIELAGRNADVQGGIEARKPPPQHDPAAIGQLHYSLLGLLGLLSNGKSSPLSLSGSSKATSLSTVLTTTLRPDRLPLRAAQPRDRSGLASTGDRHHNAGRQGHVSNDGRVCRVRAQHDCRARSGWRGPTVVHPRHAAWFVGQHRSDGSPLIVGEFVAHDSAPSVRGLNHGLAGRLNWSPCTRKRTSHAHCEFCRS